MATIWQVLIFSLIGGILSLIGGILLFSHKKLAHQLSTYATPFAAGVLLGTAFFDLLPEALELATTTTVFGWTLVGLLFFFVLERFMHWFHHHEEASKRQGEHERPTGPLVIIGDTIHNALDGVAIAAAFLVSPSTGIITSLAVAAHEVPQEVGDFGLLLKLGYSRTKVLVINVLSALSTTPVALVIFALGSQEQFPLGPLLSLTAGLFIYIAASDLIPRIHKTAKTGFAITESTLLIAGVLLIALATNLAHNYLDSSHNHQQTETHEHSEAEHSDENHQELEVE